MTILLTAFKQGFGILNKVMKLSCAGNDHKASAIVQPVCIKFSQKRGQMFMFWMRDMIYVMLGHEAMYRGGKLDKADKKGELYIVS